MKNRHSKTRRQGFSLVTTMFLMGVIAMLMAMVIQSGTQRNATAMRLINQTKAKAYAEAGVEHAYAILSVDFDERNNPSAFTLEGSGTGALSLSSKLSGDSDAVTSTYADGAFGLTVTPISNRYALVESTGECNGESVEAVALLEDYFWNTGSSTPGEPDIDGTAWEYTVFSAGKMDLGGNGEDMTGTLHSNKKLYVNGNVVYTTETVHFSSSTKIQINGNNETQSTYTAPKISINGSKDGATLNKTSVPQKAFPEYDLTELYNTALANGEVYGSKNYSNDQSWNNVPGGVKWFNGNLTIEGNANLQCIVVATGYIYIKGNMNDGKGYSGNNHVISRDSYIKVEGNVDLDGLMYAPRDISIYGNMWIDGQALTGEDFYLTGNLWASEWRFSGPTAGSSGDQTPKETLVGISAWQK